MKLASIKQINGKKIFAVAAIALTIAIAGVVSPAQAAGGQSKICADSRSYTYITAFDLYGGNTNRLVPYDNNGDLIGECTNYHSAGTWLVDTDPQGSSHSYKIRYDVQQSTGSYAIGAWNDCHTNSDNHNSDPKDPSSGTNYRVVYRNFNHGDCTN